MALQSSQSSQPSHVCNRYQHYGDSVGDYMPDEEETIVPRRLRTEEYEECCACLGPELSPADVSYFNQIIREAPELQHFKMARRILNFQNCTNCADCNEEVKSAYASHDPVRIGKAKEKRSKHHEKSRNERKC